jgi:hypothetical protein
MRRSSVWVTPDLLTALAVACADPVEDSDAGVEADAEVDAGSPDAAPSDTGTDAGALDAGDSGVEVPPDGGHDDDAPRVIDIEVAYAASSETDPLTVHLYVTETSTSRVRLTPELADEGRVTSCAFSPSPPAT